MTNAILVPMFECRRCGKQMLRPNGIRPDVCTRCKNPNWEREDLPPLNSKKRASVRPEIESATSTLPVGG
jgi:hypothetical protein